MSSFKPIVSRSMTGWNDASPLARWASRIRTRPIPRASLSRARPSANSRFG